MHNGHNEEVDNVVGCDHNDDKDYDHDGAGYDKESSVRFPFCDVFVMRSRRGVWEVQLIVLSIIIIIIVIIIMGKVLTNLIITCCR